MVTKIGVRELKNQASQIVRAVREDLAEYVITLHGKPIAVLRPLTDEEDQRLLEDEIEVEMAEMGALAQEISAAWKSDKTAVVLVAEQRR